MKCLIPECKYGTEIYECPQGFRVVCQGGYHFAGPIMPTAEEAERIYERIAVAVSKAAKLDALIEAAEDFRKLVRREGGDNAFLDTGCARLASAIQEARA